MKDRCRMAFGLSAICALMLGVSACGGTGNETAASTSSDMPSDRGEISGTVKIWDTEYGSLPKYKKAMDLIDADFEKLHPLVTIQREAQPLGTYDALLQAAFTAKNGPDLMLMQPGTAGVLSYTKGLEVLNDLLRPQLQNELLLWGAATPGFSEDGEHYGVPIGRIGNVFYYNKELFAKAGLPRRFEPKSWQDLRVAGEKLQAAGVQPFVGGNEEGFENNWWFSLGFQTETTTQQRAELANGALPYNDKAFAKSFGPEFEIEEAGLYPSTRFSKGFVEGCADFAQGRGAIIVGFTNALCDWGEFIPALGESNVGFFGAPGRDSVPNGASIVMSMPTFAENKEAALAYLEYEASKMGIKILVDVGGFMPNRADVSMPADVPIQARALGQVSDIIGTELAAGIMVSSAVTFGPMATEISEALQGRTSLQSALDVMQETAEKTPAG